MLINLGTNDWCCNQAPPPDFTGQYKQLVHNLSSVLGENRTVAGGESRVGALPFFLVSGPVSTLYDAAVQETVAWANSAGLNATLVQQNGVLNETRYVLHAYECASTVETARNRRQSSARAFFTLLHSLQ